MLDSSDIEAVFQFGFEQEQIVLDDTFVPRTLSGLRSCAVYSHGSI